MAPRRSNFNFWTSASSLAAIVPSVLAAVKIDSDIKSIPLKTHTLTSPYLDNDLQSRWFDYGGSTVIRSDQYIRLTGEHPSEAGWIFSRVPLTATNWEVEVDFRIGGKSHLFGDGMAMWLTEERGEMGQVFGMKDKFRGLGIFFDTYKNNRPGVVFPYVMAMLGDGHTSYDKATDGKPNELAGCSARGIRNAYQPTKAKVTYFQDKNLTLQLMYKEESEWSPCFDVADVKLPGIVYLGFSAETGELSDNHDIISVETKNLYSPGGGGSSTGSSNSKGSKSTKKNNNDATNNNVHHAEGGSWFGFLIKIILFLLVLVGAYVGYTVYRTRRRDRF